MKLVSKLKEIRVIDSLQTGWAFRDSRIKAGISLRALARAAGYSAPFTSDLERGRRNWTVENFEKLRKALNRLKRKAK